MFGGGDGGRWCLVVRFGCIIVTNIVVTVIEIFITVITNLVLPFIGYNGHFHYDPGINLTIMYVQIILSVLEFKKHRK